VIVTTGRGDKREVPYNGVRGSGPVVALPSAPTGGGRQAFRLFGRMFQRWLAQP